MGRLKAVWATCKARPHVWLVPCILVGVCCGLGVWAVLEGADSHEQAARQKAQSSVESAAMNMQLSIQAATMPVIQLADWIKHTRNLTTLIDNFFDRVPDWYARTTKASAMISMSPAGVMVQVYPSIPGFPLDQDVLKNKGYAEPMLESVEIQNMTVSKPVYAYIAQQIIMTFNAPVILSNVTEAELWPVYRPSVCPARGCYDPQTKTGWWGSAAMTLDVTVFLSANGPLSKLREAGYELQVWRAPDTYLGESFWTTVENATRPQPKDALSASLPIAHTEWRIYVWQTEWYPSWRGPLIAVVVVASLVCGVLVFAVLYSWQEHRMLLESILPKQAITRLRERISISQVDRDKEAVKFVDMDTPAQHMLTILKAIIQGETPSMHLVVAVQQALERSADVYSPSYGDFQSRLRDLDSVDPEVHQALVRQLAADPQLSTVISEPSSDEEDEEELPDVPVSSKLVIIIDQHQDLSMHSSDGNQASCASNADTSATAPPPVTRSTRFMTLPQASASANRNQALSPHHVPPSSTRNMSMRRMLRSIDCPRVSGPLSSSNQISPAIPDVCAVIESMMSSIYMTQTSAASEQGTVSDLMGTLDSMLPVPYSAGWISVGGKPSNSELPASFLQPDKPIMDKLDKVLVTANEWTFDAFALEEASHGRPLSVLGYWLMHTSGCIAHARMESAVLVRFLQKVEAGYRSNPYHNSRHAADVLQTFHMIIHQGGLQGYVDPLTLLACYLAALIHDYQHVGVSNDYLISVQDTLAVRYNDKSPLENHHLAAAWELLQQREYNCLANLSRAKWDRLRKLVIELVLATDMRQHFAIMGQFAALHATPMAGATLRRSDSGERRHPGIAGHEGSRPSASQPTGEHDKLLSLQVALKCSDLGHLAAPLGVHLKWVSSLEEEFFAQGDEERARGMPVSPLCDRTKAGVNKSQVGFMEFVALPLYSNFCHRFPASSPLIKAVACNYRYWKSKASLSQPGVLSEAALEPAVGDGGGSTGQH